MTLSRLCSRLATLEAQQRPAMIADVLRHAREHAPSELGACLMAQLTAVDRTTAEAIMAQLTASVLQV